MRTYLTIMLIVFISFTLFSAQLFDDIHVLDARLISSYEEVIPGMQFLVAVVVDIENGFHINSNQPAEDYFIPTVVKFDPNPHFSFGEIRFPQPLIKEFSFSEKMLSVYEGTIHIYADIQASPNVQAGDYVLKGILSYQGCDDNSCYAPG
ncbi:hypothetical protein JXO59_05990, partial [candidate division KSB1 bacterium]|nr:hypothetical protein [candidate division KSB1 bacterium]